MTPRRAQRARDALSAVAGTLTVAAVALLASGCGSAARQDAKEAKASYRLDVLHASFPHLQSIARPTKLELIVHNAGTSTAPNVAVTVDSFEYAEKFPELAADKRPIWIIDAGPGDISHAAQTAKVSPNGGGQTAYVNTWALGPLAAGVTRTFRWVVAPVKGGIHTVHYTVSAGLAGNAKAVSSSGGPVHGAFTVFVTGAPPPTHVDPNTGEVVPGPYPLETTTPRHPLRAKIGAGRSAQ